MADFYERLAHDALTVTLDNGVPLELRVFDESEYVFRWRCGGATLGVDTAPLRPQLLTFPNHLHGPDGKLRADPLTVPGRMPWENVRVVLEAVFADPLLEGG